MNMSQNALSPLPLLLEILQLLEEDNFVIETAPFLDVHEALLEDLDLAAFIEGIWIPFRSALH